MGPITEKLFALMAFVVLSVTICTSVGAQPTEDATSDGALWLLSARYENIHWGLSSPPNPLQVEFTADDFSPVYSRDSVEAIHSLQVAEIEYTNFEDTVNWLERMETLPAGLLGKKVIILNKAERDFQSELSVLESYRNADGGFGGDRGYPSNSPDTALALQALVDAQSTDVAAINGAVSYLVAIQNPDGGWGFIPIKQSEVYYTALAMQALSTQPQTTAIANALAGGTAFLLAHQNPDGGFGSSPSTVWETAHAFLAISRVTSDVAILQPPIDYLINTQQANGSWNDDPYSTALTLQALHASLNQNATLPPPPTTGTLTGTVKDGGTQAALSGVVVQVVSTGQSTPTDASGGFTISDVNEGAADLSFTKAGYQASALNTSVTAGSVQNLGTLFMTLNTNTGLITGTARDESTGNPIEGVTISASGPVDLNTVSAADGTYTMADIPIGSYSLSATIAAYGTVTATGEVTSGGTLTFSPSLSLLPTTGTVSGIVSDSETQAPIPGAAINLTGTTTADATSGPDGSYSINDVPAGAIVLTATATGYGPVTGSGSVTAGQTMNFSPSLVLTGNAPPPTTGTIQGTVTDNVTGLPLLGATVNLTGASSLSTLTALDGSYSFTGVTTGSYSVTFSLTDYQGAGGSATVTAGSLITFNAALNPTPTTGTVTGTVRDALTNLPLTGALVTQGVLQDTTDASGSFTLTTVPGGSQSFSVSATDYGSQTFTVLVTEGAITNVEGILLFPVLAVSTVQGTVVDAQTGLPIPGASLTLIETGQVTTSGGDGAYQFSDISPLTFDISIAAADYVDLILTVSVVQATIFEMDIELSPIPSVMIDVTSLTTDLPAYGALSPVSINATVVNEGIEAVETMITAQIHDPSGLIIATLEGPGPTILSPALPVDSAFVWNTERVSPGTYTASLQFRDANGIVLADGATSFEIQPVTGFADEAVGAVPRFTNVGATEAVTLELSITNQSNIDLNLTIDHEVRSPSGALLSSGTTSAVVEPDQSNASIGLASFNHSFTESGDYPVSVTVQEGVGGPITLESFLFVATPFRIDATQSITPSTVPPVGEQRIHLEIHLESVEDIP